MCVMNKLATTGDVGDPTAAPSVCSEKLLWIHKVGGSMAYS